MKIVLSDTGPARQTYSIPQYQLSVTHTAEACGQDLPIREEHSSHWLGTKVDLLFHLE